MLESPKFEIHVPGLQVSIDDDKRASAVSVSDLPPLTEEERQVAKKFGTSDEAYRRTKLALMYGHQRKEARALDLGREVEKVLADIGSGYRLVSVTWNSDTLSWRLGIETPDGKQNVVLSWELVDDALDFQTRSELERLRNMILFGLGLRDLIFEKRK